MKFLKYLSLAAAFQDVSTIYTEEQGKGRPAWYARRFLGAVATAIGVLLSVKFGVDLSAETLAQMTDNAETMIATGTTLYGVALGIWGTIKRKKS